MKIIINGAGGRMGRALRNMAQEKNIEVAAMVDAFVEEPGMLKKLADFDGQADCIIDFSHHSGVGELLSYGIAKNLPVIVCTTGHTEEELAAIAAAAKKIPVFHSGNMSLGIAVLTRLAADAARMFPDADIEIVEVHHTRKVDAPSGTAHMLFDAIQAVRPNATEHCGRAGEGKRTKEEIGISSLRMGNVVGIHEVHICTPSQTLTLRHEAGNRGMLADGAVDAARFMVGKQSGLYNMTHLLEAR